MAIFVYILTGDPFQFLVFFAGAYDFRVLAKVYLGISTVAAFVVSTFAKEVVELAEITNSWKIMKMKR